MQTRSGSRIFIGRGGGGGAQKLMSAHAHQEREARSPFRPESKARCLSILIQNGITNRSRSFFFFFFFFWGGGACCTPSGYATENVDIKTYIHVTVYK